MKDHLLVILLLVLLKLRWWYFHLCPWYIKFRMSETAMYFYNTKTNTIHSQVNVEFEDNSCWKRFNGTY